MSPIFLNTTHQPSKAMAITRASALKAGQAAAAAASTRRRSSKRTHSPPKITPSTKPEHSKIVKSKKKHSNIHNSSEDDLSGDMSVATKPAINCKLPSIALLLMTDLFRDAFHCPRVVGDC